MRKLPILLALLLLCGCAPASQNTSAGRAVQTIYCTTADSLLTSQEVALGVLERDAEIQRLFSTLTQLQLSKFCDSVSLESFSLVENTLTLQLSPEYATLNGLSRTVCNAAIVCTYCDLPYVTAVVLRSDGVETEPMTADTFLLALSDHSGEREVRFYFAERGALSSETRTLPYHDESEFLHTVIEALLLGPKTAAYTSPIPKGTRLNSVSRTDEVCTIDLSSEFLALSSHTEADERLCLFSLVNTLSSAADAEQVRILIDGASVPGFTHYDLTQAIQPEFFD